MQNVLNKKIDSGPTTTITKSMSIFSNLRRYKVLYIMSVPGIIYFIVFRYLPLLGNVIAFQDYNIFKGFLGSDFVGIKHFKTMFSYGDFIQILVNTVMINLYDLLFGFTAPLILALMINEIMNNKFQKLVQQTIYLPHFLSWTVLGGIITFQLLSPANGIINDLLRYIGREPIYFMIKPELGRAIAVTAGIWRDAGYGTIVYLAALTAISPSLYESANIDGAGKFRQMISITLPSLIPIITVLFLLRVGNFLDTGFDRIWVLLTPTNRSTIEIFDTYIYQAGLQQGRYSLSTAVGLFKSVVGIILLIGGNQASKRLTGESLF